MIEWLQASKNVPLRGLYQFLAIGFLLLTMSGIYRIASLKRDLTHHYAEVSGQIAEIESLRGMYGRQAADLSETNSALVKQRSTLATIKARENLDAAAKQSLDDLTANCDRLMKDTVERQEKVSQANRELTPRIAAVRAAHEVEMGDSVWMEREVQWLYVGLIICLIFSVLGFTLWHRQLRRIYARDELPQPVLAPIKKQPAKKTAKP